MILFFLYFLIVIMNVHVPRAEGNKNYRENGPAKNQFFTTTYIMCA